MQKNLVDEAIQLSNMLKEAVWNAAFDGIQDKHDKIERIYYKSLDRVQRRIEKYGRSTKSTN